MSDDTQDVEALRIARGLCELCGVGHRLEPCPKCAAITTALAAYAATERQAREAVERRADGQEQLAAKLLGERDTARAELAELRMATANDHRAPPNRS